jgi:hypothetical protein
VSCAPIAGGCQCELGSMDSERRPTVCAGGAGLHCCADQTGQTCTCSSSPCLATDTVVASCSIEALRCGFGEHQVVACSVRDP